jgi:hypothetical protein
MTRVQRAMNFAKQQMIAQSGGAWADKKFREEWWRRVNPATKNLILLQMDMWANLDLERVEELHAL